MIGVSLTMRHETVALNLKWIKGHMLKSLEPLIVSDCFRLDEKALTTIANLFTKSKTAGLYIIIHCTLLVVH